ncbi:MAG TPA: hypothetical protein VH877_24860 [Polyangia bacterium]|jgi:hypothetical protein|nr:hypothetical protein [Polyangia bacterium]
MTRRLVFVYAADSGLLNTAIDMAHKILSPTTYPCQLCALTYGPLGMRRRWAAFVKRLPYPAVFLHRNEFLRDHPGTEAALPALFMEEEGRLSPLVDGGAVRSCRDLDELMTLVETRLSGRPV